jgi:lipoyl-dependent peroxiredoxin
MQRITRTASVRWVAGAGRAVTTDRGALQRASFSVGHLRSQNSDTNAAELIAAAHAGSFSFALGHELGTRALRAGEILVSAAVTLEQLAAGWTIMNIHLNVVARLPRLSQGEFIDATVRAKTSCLVSRALRPTVSMNAKLEKLLRPRTGATSAHPSAHRRSKIKSPARQGARRSGNIQAYAARRSA